MSTHLSRFFRQRRNEKRLGFGQISRGCGYRNVAKGCNRIQKFEDRGDIDAGLLQKLAVVLGISDADIARFIEADKADWERWADEPTDPFLVVRLIAAFYSPKSIPPDIHSNREAMERFASDFAKEKRVRVCLVLSRRLRVWFDQKGVWQGETEDTFEKSYEPYMRLAGSGRKFLLNLLDSKPATGGNK